MEFPVSQQDLDDWATPQAYEDFVEFLRDRVWIQWKASINRDVNWPHPVPDPPVRPENPLVDTSKTAETYYLNILDVALRHTPPNQWPSGRLQAMAPPILPIYKAALIEGENRVMAAIRKCIATYVRAQIAKKMFSAPSDTTYLPVDQRDDALAGNRIVADQLGLSYQALWVCILPATRQCVMEALLPPPGDLSRYSNKLPDGPTLEETLPLKLLDAMMQDAKQVFGSTAVGSIKTPNELLSKLTDDFEVAAVDLSFALTMDYQAIIKAAALVSSYELTQVLPRYIQQLEDTWRDLRPTYVHMVEGLAPEPLPRGVPPRAADNREGVRLLHQPHPMIATTYGSMNRLERSFAMNVARRMEHSAAIFESYRANAPLIKATGFSLSSRDVSLLLDTPIGIQIMRYSQLFKPIVVKLDSGGKSISKFFSEMPRNMPNILTGAGFEVVNLGGINSRDPGLRGEVMDAIEAYFEVDGAVIDVALQERYEGLAREAKKR